MDLNNFNYTDNVNDVLAEYINQLLATSLRGELTETKAISATLALTDADLPIQNLTASGGNQTVKLPVEAIANHVLVIRNAGGANNLIVKDDSGTTTFATLLPGETSLVIPIGGLTWAVK